MQPTHRAIGLLAIGVPLSLAAVLFDERLWFFGFVYLAAVLVLIGLDCLLTPAWQDFSHRFNAPKIGFIGDSETFELTIMSPHPQRTTQLTILFDLNGDIAPIAELTVVLPPRLEKTVRIDLTAERRGNIEIERLWFRWEGPVKLARSTKTIDVFHTFAVVPNVRSVRKQALRFFSHDAFFGMKSQNQQGDGSEFSALREYVPGLDHRSIDWKQSARHRALVCKEFEAERNHQIIIAFDTGHLMSEPFDGIPKLDHAINAGLLMAYLSLRFGDRVGLFGFDANVNHYAEPVSGTHGFQLLQRVSADFDYHYEETNFTLGLADLMGRLNRRSLIIIFTDFVDTTTAELMIDSIGRLSKRHLILFVSLKDPALHALSNNQPESTRDIARAVVADGILKERQMVFERLRRLGAHCLEAPGRLISIDLVNHYLAIKRQELI
ncbi:MAG: DUF58 domain-containing protein [Rhodospirillales bacterium]|nr:DUF58 domain-containing protein [Rhodospirillales bacterium]